MSDLQTDLMAQEVDEAVRRENLHKAWKRFGKYVIGGAVGIVLVVAGREGYGAWTRAKEEANSTAFSAAMESAAADGADPVAVWQSALPGLGGGYKALGGLRLAAAAAAKGDYDAAISAYDTVIAAGADEGLTELATLQSAMLLVDKKDDLAAARSRLSRIAVKGRPWYFSALEQLAMVDLQEGDLESARTRFILLAEDADTPQSIKTRASQLRGFVERQIAAETVQAGTDAASGEQTQ